MILCSFRGAPTFTEPLLAVTEVIPCTFAEPLLAVMGTLRELQQAALLISVSHFLEQLLGAFLTVVGGAAGGQRSRAARACRRRRARRVGRRRVPGRRRCWRQSHLECRSGYRRRVSFRSSRTAGGLASAGHRFGEASNPGPTPPVACLTANLGSWQTMRTWVEACKDDFLLLQETRVAPRGLTAAKASLSRAGWSSVWAPADPNPHGPASGGLAICCREPRRIHAIPHDGEHAHRWLHAVVELGARRPLHVATVYGYDSGQPQAARRNAELFASIFSAMAGLGDARWLIGGDWNTEPHEIWELTADEGKRFFWPADPAAAPGGTCKSSWRRIDFFVASHRLHGEITAESAVEAPLYPHRPVRLQLASGGRPAPVPVLDIPAAYLGPGQETPIGPQPPASMAWDTHEAVWLDALRSEDLDALWTCWCTAGEDWLTMWTGLSTSRFRGRGAQRRLVQRQRRSRERAQPDGALSTKTSHWLSIVRWLRDLRRQATSSSPAAAAQAQDLFCRLDEAMADPPAAPGLDPAVWRTRRASLLGAPPETLDEWAVEAEEAFQACQREAARARRDGWQQWTRDCVRRRPGLLYRWLRGDTIPPAQGCLGRDGWTLHPGDVAEAARTAWARLWCPTDGPSVWAPRQPMATDLPPISGAELQDVAQRLQRTSAAGADGWRAAEIRALPFEFWERLAQMIQVCERLGQWPAALRIGVVSLLPKAEATAPESMRPVVLLPMVYRIWAAARQPWVRSWASEAGADGAEIPGQGAADAAWELAFEAEMAELAGGESMCGAFLDCSKCYERVPLAELDARACALQFPDPLLVLALHMYSAPRHVRVGDAFAKPVSAACGIMAGCGMATALLRAHLRETMDAQGQGTRRWRLRRYFDDMVL